MVTYSIFTSRTLPNRSILSLSLLLLLCLLFLRNSPFDNPLHRLTDLDIESLVWKTNATEKNIPWATPPRLREHVKFIKGSVQGNELAKHVWTQPRMLTSFARPLVSKESWTEVLLYVTGVLMGKYERKLSVAGCLVGFDVYNASNARGEVFVCSVPRRVQIGQIVSLVLRRDDALRRALQGETIGGLDVKIQKDDIWELPKGTRMHVSGSLDANDYVMIRSNVRIERVSANLVTLRQRVRYKVCMGTQLKTFPDLLYDWVIYHRKLGVDMVYVLDNNSAEDLSKVVANITGVEVLYWPFQKSQTQAWSYVLVALRERCEWLLLSDADEYVLIGVDEEGAPGGLREYLDRVKEGVSQKYIPYVTMGASGHIKRAKGPVAEEYLYKHSKQKRSGKVIARTDADWLSSAIHLNKARRGSDIKFTEVRNEKPRVGDGPVLIHFQRRSFEEMVEKRDAGSGSVRDMKKGIKSGWEKNIPREFRVIREGMRYTYFRDVWRKVMRLRERQVFVRDGKVIRSDSL